MSYKGIAEMVLEAQGKLGRVLKQTVIPGGDKSRGSWGGTTSLPPTITKKESYIAQSIAKNQEVVNDQK